CMELSVVDGDGAPVPSGVEGDLLVRGPFQFVGYYKRPQFTADGHTRDGWFKTGDRATLDGDGYVSITGRSKDIIIRGGENIPVVEVENLLYAHPKIVGVAIVAMADPRLVERCCAVVIPREGQTLTLGEITIYLEGQQLARHKFPERLEIVSEFPMTPSGKIQKYRLRQLVAERLASSPSPLQGERAGCGRQDHGASLLPRRSHRGRHRGKPRRGSCHRPRFGGSGRECRLRRARQGRDRVRGGGDRGRGRPRAGDTAGRDERRGDPRRRHRGGAHAGPHRRPRQQRRG